MEATQKIRNGPEYIGIPIVAMTGNSLEVDKQRCTEAGMVDDILKHSRPARIDSYRASLDERKSTLKWPSEYSAKIKNLQEKIPLVFISADH